uniref:Cytochrom_C_asm domain-containing protein n=1 Tax=Rhabditophanes sp. KR3021 TaxID=114890 RepID=A0AC35UB71_9BILA
MAFVSSYVISVSMGHVNAFLPFLSDSGTLHPESSIFGQLLNLSALFLALTVYLRHRQIVEFYWHRHHIRDGGFGWRFWSTLLLWIGFVSALGVSMVANFQQSVTTLYYHYLGALLAFGNGLVYAWAMTIFSYIMTPKLFDKRLSHCRCLLCVIATVAFLTSLFE